MQGNPGDVYAFGQKTICSMLHSIQKLAVSTANYHQLIEMLQILAGIRPCDLTKRQVISKSSAYATRKKLLPLSQRSAWPSRAKDCSTSRTSVTVCSGDENVAAMSSAEIGAFARPMMSSTI